MLRASNLFAFCVIAIMCLLFSAEAAAQTYSGQATAVRATVLTGATPGVTTAVSDTGPLPSAGGTITMASASATVAGIVTAGASTVSTSGSGGTSQSSASIEQLDINIAGLANDFRVRAATVASTTVCTCPTGACTGSSTITNLRIGTRGGGAVITVSGVPNQTVVVTVGSVTMTITINEQIVGPNSLTVNALHIRTTDSLTGITTDVLVASSHSDITCSGPPLSDKYSGRATGVRLGVSTLLPPSQVATIIGDTGPLPTSGGSIGSAITSANVTGVLSTGAVTSNTSGSGDTSQSDSTVTNLSATLIGAVTIDATLIESDTQCACAMTPPVSCTGSSSVANLAVTAAGVPVDITISGAPNQVVTLPSGLGTIIINEQISAGPGDITVNALHVMLTPLGLASTDLVIAHSHSDIVCFVGPTAAGAAVTGRILNADGDAVPNATVRFTSQDGDVWTSVSNGFGQYLIEDIPVGETYMVQVSHKRFTFTPLSISPEDNVSDFDIVANP